jgi:D-3-phosphoglycerate dehydrogenase / 2-oxoglutarate reductase
VRVLIREQIAEAGIDLLRERFDVDIKLDGDLATTIGDYDAIIIRSGTDLTEDLIERADRPGRGGGGQRRPRRCVQARDRRRQRA